MTVIDERNSLVGIAYFSNKLMLFSKEGKWQIHLSEEYNVLLF